MNKYSYERKKVMADKKSQDKDIVRTGLTAKTTCRCEDSQTVSEKSCTAGRMKKCTTQFEGCDAFCTHADIIQKVNDNMPDEETLYDLAEFFKVFGDSTRIRILYVLFESEMCVCDIAELLNMTQSAISHQLRILKQMQLVKNRRDGKTIFYSLSDGHIESIINQGMEHIKE